jgi:hypothetical protein
VKRRTWTEKLKENAPIAFGLAVQLAQDQEFRTRLISALEHSKEARRRARPSRGVAGVARRLAADQGVQAELQEARKDLEQAYALVGTKRRGRRLRRIIPLAGIASLAAVPQVRERISGLIETASRNRELLQDLAAATVPGRDDGRPNTLDALTKEELYARAQAAEIPGRSEMSKEELVAALRAKN